MKDSIHEDNYETYESFNHLTKRSYFFMKREPFNLNCLELKRGLDCLC